MDDRQRNTCQSNMFFIAAWQQHDVQELCRVMFDALEKTWRKTDQADIINTLYQGQMKDYVKCLEVHHLGMAYHNLYHTAVKN